MVTKTLMAGSPGTASGPVRDTSMQTSVIRKTTGACGYGARFHRYRDPATTSSNDNMNWVEDYSKHGGARWRPLWYASTQETSRTGTKNIYHDKKSAILHPSEQVYTRLRETINFQHVVDRPVVQRIFYV